MSASLKNHPEEKVPILGDNWTNCFFILPYNLSRTTPFLSR